MTATVLHGDCLEVMRDLPDASVHAVVCDPPYGLSNTTPAQVTDALTRWLAGERDYAPTGRGFMGKAWDAFVSPPAVWDECLRVLKPGGHLLAFAGSRTAGLMETSIRLAQFDIRDSIAWLHGQGMPKGKGQLKPALEPIVVARKPFTGSTASNVAAHGTGTLNTDATRTSAGRWPTNVVVGDATAAALDGQGPWSRDGIAVNRNRPDDGSVKPHSVYSNARNKPSVDQGYGGEGGPSRFFPVFQEQEPCDFPATSAVSSATPATTNRSSLRPTSGDGGSGVVDGAALSSSSASPDWPFRYQAKAPTRERPAYIKPDGTRVAHPTVKPVELMRWLVRLVTPPGGTVLDPFAGSGATLEAALLEGFDVTAIEREADYLPLIQQRIDRVTARREAA